MLNIPRVSEKVSKLSQLKSEKVFGYLSGDYKKVRDVSKQIAHECANDFDIFLKSKSAEIKNVPIFSKFAIKTIWVKLLEQFTRKTPEEKLLNARLMLHKLNQERFRTEKLDRNINKVKNEIFYYESKVRNQQ